jgi:hypothetical protein
MVALPSLFYHIGNVVLSCSREKMARIYAQWIIAVMTYNNPVFNFSKVYDVAVAMRINLFVKIANNAISVFVDRAFPYPAFVATGYLGIVPKEIGRAIYSNKMRWVYATIISAYRKYISWSFSCRDLVRQPMNGTFFLVNKKFPILSVFASAPNPTRFLVSNVNAAEKSFNIGIIHSVISVYGSVWFAYYTTILVLTIIVSLPFALSAVAMLLETWWRNKQ